MDYPGRIIKIGESDSRPMRAVRARLRELQFEVSASGAFDASFSHHVRLFQTRNVDQFSRNLVPDGEIGPLTWAAMFEVAAKSVRKIPTQLARCAVDIARTQIGVREHPRNSNGGKEVEKYLRAVNFGPGYAWCAAFVYWCLQEASSQVGVPNSCARVAGVLAQWNHAQARRLQRVSAVTAKEDPSLVKPGMVFVIDCGGGLGHTGFVTSIQGALLSTIEGNTDASKSREGGGVYSLTRKVGEINKGYILYG